MKLYNNYIITTAVALLLTTVILIATGQSSLETYCLIYFIETLTITELLSYFNARARRGLNIVGFALLGGFFVIIITHIIKIL